MHFANSLRLLELSLIALAEHLSLLSTIIHFSSLWIGLIESASNIHFEVRIFEVVQAKLSRIAAVLKYSRSNHHATSSCRYTLLRLQGRRRRLQERRRSEHLSRRQSAWNWEGRVSTVHRGGARVSTASWGSLDCIELRMHVFILVCVVDGTALSAHATGIDHLSRSVEHGVELWHGYELLLVESASILVQLWVADYVHMRLWIGTADMRAWVAATVQLWLVIGLIVVLLLVLCGGSLRYLSRKLCLVFLQSNRLVVNILSLRSTIR